IFSVIDVQAPRLESSSETGVGPRSPPPADSGSSASHVCLPSSKETWKLVEPMWAVTVGCAMRAPDLDGKTPRVRVHRVETAWRGVSCYCERNYPPSRLWPMRV